ncbi:3-hydroxyacyl-CoA dehydrogenase, partial [Burkholderia sp. SIMBA_052]
RKAGEGFYVYVDGKQQAPAEAPAPTELPKRVWISARVPAARDAVVALISKTGVTVDEGTTPAADSLIVVTPLGFDATTAAFDENLD